MMTARLLLLFLMSGLTLTGCLAAPPASGINVNSPNSFEPLLVASDMIAVMRQDWPPALTRVWVSPSQFNKILDSVLRRMGYAIDPEREAGAISVDFSFHKFGETDWWKATLVVNENWRLTRFYKSEGGRITPASGFTLGGGRGIKSPFHPGAQTYRVDDPAANPTESPRQWFVEVLKTSDSRVLEDARTVLSGMGLVSGLVPAVDSAQQALRVGPFIRLLAARNALGDVRTRGFDQAFLLSVKEASIHKPAERNISPAEATNASCSTMLIKQGSLRSSVERLVKDCGYKMGGWGLGEGSKTVDWVVRDAYTISVETGIWGLLDLLHNTYGIRGDIQHPNKVVHFREVSYE